MLKLEELRGLAVDELEEKTRKLKKELMQYRFQAKTGKLERQNILRETRRDIARILTVMNEKSEETPARPKVEKAKPKAEKASISSKKQKAKKS